MKNIIILIALFGLGCSVGAGESDALLRAEFKKFFNELMPVTVTESSKNTALYIDPKDNEVLPVQEQLAHISVHIKVPGLKRLLLLHGKNTYPEKVCKPAFKKTFIAGYKFDPALNTSYSLTTMRIECGGSIIVWAQTNDGRFYKAEKTIRVFNYHN